MCQTQPLIFNAGLMPFNAIFNALVLSEFTGLIDSRLQHLHRTSSTRGSLVIIKVKKKKLKACVAGSFFFPLVDVSNMLLMKEM